MSEYPDPVVAQATAALANLTLDRMALMQARGEIARIMVSLREADAKLVEMLQMMEHPEQEGEQPWV